MVTYRSPFKHIFLAIAWMFIAGCEVEDKSSTIREQGTLKVITRNGPTTYYEDKSGPTGFEYELIKRFAESENLNLHIQTAFSLKDIFKALETGEAHIAAAGLTVTKEREQRFDFSPPYMKVKQYLLYHNRQSKPKRIEDVIGGRTLVIANSSHSDILTTLSNQHPNLQWHSATDVEAIDLFDMMADNKLDYTLVDSNDFIANKSFYPQIKVAFEVGSPGELAWVMPKQPNDKYLKNAITTFFSAMKKDGTLRQLEERFYSHNEQLTQIDSRTFARAVEKKLPKYIEMIKRIALEHSIDWRLLAAISYQESHWNPKAKSPTGVRGMMMLTMPTAKEMGVTNRLNAEQSLRGGAAYFKKTLNRIPSTTKEPDRTWMALAAYNVGWGHVMDARKITQQRGGDFNKWSDVKDSLPLLRKRRWYKKTKHGYARGQEPVHYVRNIRHFYNYLEWSELAQKRTPPPIQVDQYIPETLLKDFNTL